MNFHDDIIDEIQIQTGDGLHPKDWRKAIDQYLTEKTLSSDDYTLMNKEQRNIIQEIKKSYARTKRK